MSSLRDGKCLFGVDKRPNGEKKNFCNSNRYQKNKVEGQGCAGKKRSKKDRRIRGKRVDGDGRKRERRP